MSSPTQRSLAYLRKEGWTVAITERWNAFSHRREDLFGFIDLLALRDGTTLAVQVTSTGVSARVKKITDSPLLPVIRKAGWSIHVHGWRKGANGRYALRVVDLS